MGRWKISVAIKFLVQTITITGVGGGRRAKGAATTFGQTSYAAVVKK